ncbi:DNA phosphorothioation-associated putative methyltransferase [uncultured Thiocystis sp.]|jgi:DNA phosphorothioation-associated putative methyltransferase|uniref:DNA phosphorothioation-associated putative methyltransferase n=1 Tax=uncultured Thiocystis sp. TaxID=1202134 RepID=UPI0025D89AE9|nr:DNA phosphorothioation-associated putative methyltransferase [uncultured Thiocystis sp.]
MSSIPSKVVGGRTYVHVDVLPLLDPATAARVAEAERLARRERRTDFNLVRIDDAGPCIALLNYPELDEEPFPALRESWLVDLERATVSYRTYADSRNPPILHRKELLLPADHPRREASAALTATCESIGLFDDVKRIGYRHQWQALVREKGYRIEGHALVPLGNDDSDRDDEEPAPAPAGWQASRHLTALTRYGFSAPVQSLARHGFLDGRYRLFDYGCGRGDDVRGLVENGLDAAGWDPFHASDQPIQSADLVNLGFVINVIEDVDERLAALTRAWSLAERLLVVSVMLANQNAPRGERFRDGVMTRRGTFQRYFSQAEIKAWLEQALDEEAIPVAPGVLYVFRDKDAEQRFLLNRYRPSAPLRASQRRSPSGADGNLRRSPRQEGHAPSAAEGKPRRDRAAERYAALREPLDRLWDRWLSLGRPPDLSEVDDPLALTEGFGSLSKALRFLAGRQDPAEIEQAAAARAADLTVYFALMQFARRKPYRHLERGLQQDIKAFFGDYAAAQAQALELLFRIADVESLAEACRQAAEQGLGWLDPGQSLQLHASLVERLPPLLRIYVGCAAVLYGDARHADLVKIHIGSGKVSLMRYDDFAGQPLPRLIERVKIKLRDLDIEYFAYGEEYAPPYLFRKSRYLNEEFPNYPEQVAFEQTLDALGLCDPTGHGPPPAAFLETLARRRWILAGFDLARPRTLAELDAPCGRFLTFRQLIACGETQASTGLPNLPQQPESYDALLELAERVLDPVIDYFGMIRLTYGFCSPQLARRIPGRIDPRRDQHAAHELNRLGKPVCERLGAAVDFIVEDESMLEVARWIVANTPFDRLYFYGDDLPIHVSHGPNQDRQIVMMSAGKAGRLVPRVVPSLPDARSPRLV